MQLAPVFAFAALLVTGCPTDKVEDTAPEDTDVEDTDVEPPTENCLPIEIEEGADDEFVQASGDTDVKHHFYMPGQTDHLRASVTWDDPSFEFEFATGIGYCPHDGVTYGDGTGKGEVIVDVYPDAVEKGSEHFPGQDEWFVHIALLNTADFVEGDSTPVHFAAEACRTPEK